MVRAPGRPHPEGVHVDHLTSAVISGAGASGLLHALALRAAGVRIAAIWDPDLERAAALADAVGARAVTSFEALVAADAGLAAVCSPPSVHVVQARALGLGEGDRVVLVEKPVATDEAELASLLALPRCVPIVQWRAGRGLRALRAAVLHGELGEAPVVSCELAWGRDEAYFHARDATWGCGALLSIGIHALDAVTWALGRRVASVAGVTLHRSGVRGETGAVGVLRYEGGPLVSLRLSLDGGADTTRIVACGNGVTAVLEGSEADPTGAPLRWSAPAATRARLEALERASSGALGAPLLVPYLAGVLAGLRAGERPGDTDRLPAIEGTRSAHEAAMLLARAS